MSISGYDAEGNAIQARFAGSWVTDDSPPKPLTLIAWENVAFTAPGSGPGAPEKQDWVRIQVLGSDATVVSIGGPQVTHRHGGDVVIEIFGLPNTGPARVRQLADKACSIFRGWQSGGMVFWTPRVVDVGLQDGWYRKNVICPFQRDTAFAHQ